MTIASLCSEAALRPYQACSDSVAKFGQASLTDQRPDLDRAMITMMMITKEKE